MAVQTIETYKGYEVRVLLYIDEDGNGGEPDTWASATDGVTLIGVATDVSTSASTDVTDITGLNQQTPYNTKQSNISYEWSLDQLYTTTEWQDDATSPVSYNPVNMINSGMKFAIQIAGMDAKGETASDDEFTVVLTQCSISDDELSVSGSDGDMTFTMSGKAASRTAVVA